MHRSLGSTLVETIFVVAITLILIGIVADRGSAFRDTNTLTTNVDQVVALLNDARSRTLAGDGASQYGVHLASDRVVLFVGSVYSATASTNKTITLDPLVSLGSVSLSGSGDDVIFSKLTGTVTGYGTFVISTVSGSASKTITVSRTGIVSST